MMDDYFSCYLTKYLNDTQLQKSNPTAYNNFKQK